MQYPFLFKKVFQEIFRILHPTPFPLPHRPLDGNAVGKNGRERPYGFWAGCLCSLKPAIFLRTDCRRTASTACVPSQAPFAQVSLKRKPKQNGLQGAYPPDPLDVPKSINHPIGISGFLRSKNTSPDTAYCQFFYKILYRKSTEKRHITWGVFPHCDAPLDVRRIVTYCAFL